MEARYNAGDGASWAFSLQIEPFRRKLWIQTVLPDMEHRSKKYTEILWNMIGFRHQAGRWLIVMEGKRG